MKRVALTLVLLSFVLGCAGAATQSQQSPGSDMVKTKKIPHNFDDVWPAVLETLNNQSWPIAVAEKQAGEIATEFVEIGFDEINKYGSCPMGFDSQIMRGRMKIESTLVRQSLYECSMSVAVSIHGWDEGSAKAWKNCESTGKVEELIYEGVNKRLSIR